MVAMDFANEPVFQWLAQYAYQPYVVYAAVLGMMIASAFGLPIPEEMTIISVAILAFMGANPESFPPPYPGAPVVGGYEAAIYLTLVILFADFIIYSLGRVLGRRAYQIPFLSKVLTGATMAKVNGFIKKYGIFATFIFRFTPGFRFPAHLFLGMSGFSMVQFLLVDLLACVISIPTQVLLVYHYGEDILGVMYKFKVYVGIGLGIIALVLILRRLWQWFSPRIAAS